LFVVAGASAWSAVAFADPPPPDPAGAVDPSAPPLAPLAPPSSTPPAALPTPLALAEAEPYPEMLVDRPLTLFAGMTSLGAAYEFKSTTTKVFTNQTPDVGVTHSFGDFELSVNVGTYATLSADIPLGANAAVVLGAESGVPQADNSLHVDQYADLEYKAPLVPSACAVFFAVGASYNENRLVDPSAMLVWTHVFVGSADGEFELQVLPTVALDVGLAFTLPFGASDGLVTRSYVSATGTLMTTVAHSWDLYASGAVIDLGTNRLPFLSFGFAKRWGG